MIRTNEAGDILFVTVQGWLGAEELNRMVTLVETAIERHDKVHMLVEVEAFTGFDPAVLGDYLPRALAMLPRLDRFGRIAIVADQKWVRWASRVESALLPNISYEIYEPADRAQAHAWVIGESLLAHAAAIRIIGADRPDVFVFEIDGAPGADEVRATVAKVNALLDAHPRISVLARIKRLEAASLAAFLSRDYFGMKWRAAYQVRRYAVVGGPPWLKNWVSGLAPLLPLEISYFAETEEPQAWRWLEAAPVATSTGAGS